MKNRLGFLFFSIILGASSLGGLLGDRLRAGSTLEGREELIKRFTETLALIEEQHFRKISTEKLVESAIQGLLRTLDPHSSFFTTPDYSRLQEEQKGKYYGLGITIRPEGPGSGHVMVMEPPVPGTPAYKAGLRAGDIIVEIRGESIEDWDVNTEVIPNLKGPKGTTVDIRVERPGEPQLLPFTVERDEIPLYTIKHVFYVRPGIGYIRIDKFSETTNGELVRALKQLEVSTLEGLVLDLRRNPGGALQAAIDVSGHFLERDQLVVSTRSRDRSDDKRFLTRQHASNYFPMVVLIDGASASASEIVAGALQDHKRALIVGETSFGKALVQTIFPLDRGRRGLALTTGKYYTPANRLIQRDYSDGFYNYYYSRRRPINGVEDEKSDGGIKPNEFVPSRKASPFFRQITSKDIFFKFARKVWTQEIPSRIPFDSIPEDYTQMSRKDLDLLIGRTQITPELLEYFKVELRSNNISFDDEAFNKDLDVIQNRILQQLYTKLFGDRESYRASLTIDLQVQRALELLPEAESLLGDGGPY
jgi:carboxyl-terminal processing protease